MYKLILADDEREIREGLKEVLPFEELGFTVVGEAANGVEALQLCEQLEPDLLITDIRMPLMDGLTLCRRVREALPATEFIILSGYDDFEYARQAIEVKTMGYLLKPISSQEFSDMLRDAKASLDEAFGRRRDVSQLRAHFHDSLPLLREMLLGALLQGEVAAQRSVERASRYGMDLVGGGYAVALMRYGEDAPSDGGIDDDELWLFAVRNVLEETLGERAEGYRLYSFMYRSMPAVLYVLPDCDDATLQTVAAHLDEARKTVRHYLDCALHIGLSEPCAELAHIPAAARQAQDALDQSVLDGQSQVLRISDIRPVAQQALRADEPVLRDLVNALKMGSLQAVQAALALLMQPCRQNAIGAKEWQMYLMEIFLAVVRTIAELGLPREELDPQVDRLSQQLLGGVPTVDEAIDALLHMARTVISSAENQRRTSSRQLAEKAGEYLRQNFGDADLSLEKLCAHLHISPSYLSMVLKKETKKTFHQYLTELRMDRALTLLATSDLKTAQIAAEVGLPDPSYFSYCFKKHFGYPPSKARRKERGNE